MDRIEQNATLLHRFRAGVKGSALIFFIAVGAAMTLIPKQGYAAVVTKLIKKKRVAVIDEGKSAGFIKKSKVCFYDGPKKIACGRVLKAKTNKAYVRVSRRSIKGISVGMGARIQGKKSTRSASNSYFRINYQLSALTPVSFQKVTYDRPPVEGNVESLWAGTEVTSSSLLGVSASFCFELGLPIALGYTAIFYGDYLSQADYDSDIKNFEEITQSASLNGLWFEIFPHNLVVGSNSLNFGYGIGYDSSTVILQGAFKNDSGSETKNLDATSTITVISARLSIDYVINAGRFGLSFGLGLAAPVSASAPAFSGGAEEDTNVGSLGKITVEDAILNTLQHKAASTAAITAGLQLFF